MDCSLFVLTTPLVVFTATLLGYFVGIKNYEYKIEKLEEYNSELEKLIENTQDKLDKSLRRLEAVSDSLDSDEI
jgi:hypothetical protein